MMTEAKRRIIELLVRYQNAASAARDRYEEAYVYDRQFDAGEFSGPANHRAMMTELDQIAYRLGLVDAAMADELITTYRVYMPETMNMGPVVTPLPD